MEKIYSKLKRQEEINAKFNDLLKSGKMKLNISLEQSTKRRNIVIDDEFDEDQLTARRNEYYSILLINFTCVHIGNACDSRTIYYPININTSQYINCRIMRTSKYSMTTDR